MHPFSSIHPTISVSSVTPPSSEIVRAPSVTDSQPPIKMPTLRPSMATAGLVIAARNDFQVEIRGPMIFA
jgi:hypothetical protein